MRGNETIIAKRLRRSKTLTLLLVVLFTLSTMSLPACSDDNGSPQRFVQAMVYFEDAGPVAIATVRDGAKNLVSDAILTINNRPLEVVYLGDEASVEGGVPYFYLELRDLKGGDSLSFVAKYLNGTIFYAPTPAQIPMPLKLVEPTPEQSIRPGEEVVVSWTGGEGGTYMAALYADNQGAEEYIDLQKYAGVTRITVPAGVIREGFGIIGAAALDGDISTVQSGTGGLADESSFVVFTYAVASIDAGPAAVVSSGGISWHPGCPKDGWGPERATDWCIKQPWMVIVLRLIIWTRHWVHDSAHFPPCPAKDGGDYCMAYMTLYGKHWQQNCLCPR